MVANYRSVLSVPGSVRLLSTALLGRLPQGMASLAILLLVRATTHSYAAAGLAVGAYALTNAACVPLQGRLVDRLGRVRVLAPSAVSHAGVVLPCVAGAAWPGDSDVNRALSDRGRASSAGHTCRFPARLRGAAGAVERGQHGGRTLVWLAGLAVAAGHPLPRAARAGGRLYGTADRGAV